MFPFFRIAKSRPADAAYLLHQKCLYNLDLLISNFSDSAEMTQIIQSPKVDMEKSDDLLATVHSYFATFQNKYLPIKQSTLQYNTTLTTFENCKQAISKIRQIFQLIKDLTVHPEINKISTLLELEKLTTDLKECVTAYVEML